MVRRPGVLCKEGKEGKSKPLDPGLPLPLFASDSSWLRWAVKGVSSPSGLISSVGVRLGVVGARRSALAAEEKKSPVVGGSRLGDLFGVLKVCARLELVGVGVVARVVWWSSVKR